MKLICLCKAFWSSYQIILSNKRRQLSFDGLNEVCAHLLSHSKERNVIKLCAMIFDSSMIFFLSFNGILYSKPFLLSIFLFHWKVRSEFVFSPSSQNHLYWWQWYSLAFTHLTSKLGFDDYFIKLRDNEASTPFAIVCFPNVINWANTWGMIFFLLFATAASSVAYCATQPPLLHHDACDFNSIVRMWCKKKHQIIIGVMERNK